VLPYLPPAIHAFAISHRPDTLLAAIPRARRLTCEGAGHAIHWEEPSRFARDLTAFVLDAREA
jgi:pimeloyl-ACP methyl ester carboxylesterase